jgi:hypothetical protein
MKHSDVLTGFYKNGGPKIYNSPGFIGQAGDTHRVCHPGKYSLITKHI